MKTTLAALFSFALSAGIASAATITVEAFDGNSYGNGFGTGAFVGENFEAAGTAQGEGEVGLNFSTSVGVFNTAGGTGSGGTVTQLPGNTGQFLALRDGNVFGRTDQVGGTYFLDSNDTLGINWFASTGSMFNTVMFVLTDHGEFSELTVNAGGASEAISGLRGSTSQLVTIVYDTPQSSALITLDQARNDGFSIDGAQVGLAPVPLPASGLLLLAGIGGIAVARRRGRAKA
ncbi:VPLPA-CTERM sorting domain-containing protein [Gymnodinialimonas ulvae]|uniref:VPLPA-CTERM sorting domain-containing protein n=1 Tax=Gymnodinialimonas ulvae TaxID=3126504 RepID=UPI0030A3A45E